MISKRRIYYSLNPSLRLLARRVYHLPEDIRDIITGKRDKSIPPRGLIYTGPGDFRKIGEHYLSVFRQHCGLKPDHKVLDVGCGIGRIAIPLTRYLDDQGTYDGFDIVRTGIDWCRKNITPRHPNFRFAHINLKNDLYNLKSSIPAKDFTFPYAGNHFDLVVLVSVFTHMLPEDMENYVREISRVLKPGGRCLATFFLLNSDHRKFLKPGTAFSFDHDSGHYSLMDKNVREANIAYEESYLTNLLRQNHLNIDTTIYCHWSGRPGSNALDFQDTLIFTKNTDTWNAR